MKITATVTTTACVAAVFVPLVATFAPSGFARHRSTATLQAGVGDDVPDLVKAYSKAKATVELPDIKLPEVVQKTNPLPPTPPPPPTPEIVVPKVKPIEVPSAPSISSDVQSSVSDSVDAVKQSIPSLQETSDSINANFKGMNDFFKASQEQAVARAAERSAAKVPTLGEMISNGFTVHRATFTESSGGSSSSSSNLLPEGKTPTLVEYFASGLKSPAGGLSMEALTESKAKLVLLLENTRALFGQTSGRNPWDVNNLPGNMSPETAAVIVTASIGLLVIAGQSNQNKGSEIPDAATTVELVDKALKGDDKALSGLAEDVVRCWLYWTTIST